MTDTNLLVREKTFRQAVRRLEFLPDITTSSLCYLG